MTGRKTHTAEAFLSQTIKMVNKKNVDRDVKFL